MANQNNLVHIPLCTRINEFNGIFGIIYPQYLHSISTPFAFVQIEQFHSHIFKIDKPIRANLIHDLNMIVELFVQIEFEIFVHRIRFNGVGCQFESKVCFD